MGSCANINNPTNGAKTKTLTFTHSSVDRFLQASSLITVRNAKNNPHLKERIFQVDSFNENWEEKNCFIIAFS